MAADEVVMVACAQGSSLRMGIMGIERSIEKSQQETSKNVSAVRHLTVLLEYMVNVCVVGIQGP